MPRNRVRKTNIGQHSQELMQSAVDLVLKENFKIRVAAKLKGIPYTTLQRYCKKVKAAAGPVRLTPNYEVHKIFTEDQERAIVDYIIKCSQMFYGLTTIECRQLAYQMADINKITIPDKWHVTKLAGKEWLYNFRRRHSCLSLRTPEGCSLSRATSFNRHNVNIFFDNLHDAMSREPVFGDGTRVYNLDETNTMTVQKSAKVLVAVKGQKQVSKVTSAEKGTLVTTCCIVNAVGYSIPPVMIFPRVHFKQHMIAGAPTGTLGLASQSGWMNTDLFVETMQHFIKHTNSSKENPSLLIMDNFEAHISLKAIHLARENGVTILTVPPHSTGKLQPLDVAIFKPFKVYYNAAVDSWMMRNSGKTFSIYEVAACVGEAHMKAMTPENIYSAFKNTGIFPYNRNIFTEVDFAPSEVTNREENRENIPISTETNPGTQTPVTASARTPSPLPGTSNDFVSPLQFRGLPKAGPRKLGKAQRRKGKSMIATDTPNKQEIEQREKEKGKKAIKKNTKDKKRKILESDSSEQDEIYSEEEASIDGQDDETLITQQSFTPLNTLPKEGNYILVEFKSSNKTIYYIGKVLQGNEKEVEASFLRKSGKINNTFRMPDVPDIAVVPIYDIKMILPQPNFCGNTKRQQSFYKFDLDFSQMDLR